MVEKITVSPQEVRGYGNVVDEKELEDYGSYRCDVSENSEVIKGVEERIFSVSGVPAPALSIANVTEDTRMGICAHISASLEDGEGDGLDDKAISLKSGDDVLATITTGSGDNVFDVVLYDSAQLYAVFDGDDYYPPAVSEVITLNPARSLWDVEFSFDEEEYEVGDTAILSGTVGTIVDEIVDGEIVTRRQMEANVTLALVTDLGIRRCSTNSNGEFALQVPNIQQNQWRVVIAATSTHLVFNALIDVPVHDYSIVISGSENSTAASTILVVGLTDFNSMVEGATISIAGSDGSSYTAVTDSMGGATVNVGRLNGATTFTATYGNVSSTVTVVPPLDWYDASNYTAGSGRMPSSRASSIYLQAVGGRWLNREFTDSESYVVEFDLILSKNNREGFYFGANPNSNTNSGISIFKDISNTMIETFDSTGTAIRLESSLSGSYFNTGTHHIRIERDYDVAYIYFDEDLIFEFDDEILSYGAEDQMYNTIGILSWGSGIIEFGNFELSD